MEAASLLGAWQQVASLKPVFILGFLLWGIRNLGGEWVTAYMIANFTTPNYCFVNHLILKTKLHHFCLNLRDFYIIDCICGYF